LHKLFFISSIQTDPKHISYQNRSSKLIRGMIWLWRDLSFSRQSIRYFCDYLEFLLNRWGILIFCFFCIFKFVDDPCLIEVWRMKHARDLWCWIGSGSGNYFKELDLNISLLSIGALFESFVVISWVGVVSISIPPSSSTTRLTLGV